MKCRKALTAHNITSPNPELITDMLQFILTKNYFQFNDKFYLQIHGTAMGSKVAPSYANIAMGKLENEIISTSPLKPTKWGRFIDDVRYIWAHGRNQLIKFHEHCNSIHPTLKFTMELSTDEVPFLDTTIQKQGNKIQTTVFSKQTDKHTYLLPSSCHPRHIFNSIPKAQAIRYRRICSNTELYDLATKELHGHFTDRNYKSKAVTSAIKNARNKPRDHLINYQNRNTNSQSRIPLVLTYHPSLPSISSIINKHWTILTTNSTTRQIFDTPPMVAYRQPPNLKKIIVKASLRSTTKKTIPGTCKPCNNCKTCRFMYNTNESEITNKLTDKSHPIVGNLTCYTRNLIYAIICTKCDMLYIGETKRELKIRISEHLNSIRNSKDTLVAHHFHQPGHSINHFQFLGLCKIFSRKDKIRKQLELKIIATLNTLSPTGINKKDW